MAFDDFKKDDLDFGSLISSDKPKKKFPKSSEGLRFLSRNLKQDVEKRYSSTSSEIRQQPPSLEKVLEQNLAVPSPAVLTNESNNVSRNVPRPRSKSSTGDLPKSEVITASSISTIERNDPDVGKMDSSNSSIENFELDNDQGSIASIEVSEPSNFNAVFNSADSSIEIIDLPTIILGLTSQKLDFSFNRSSESLSIFTSIDAHLSSDLSTEAISEQMSQHQATNETIYAVDSLNAVANGSISSIEQNDFQQLDDLISSIEINDPVTKPSDQLDADSSFSSIEIFKPATSTRIKSTITKSISSIEVFNPVIPSNNLTPHKFKISGNYTKLSHGILRHTENIDSKSLYLYLYLYRLSFGWNKSHTQIPVSQYFLKNALEYSKNTVVKCLKTLQQNNLIKPKDTVSGTGVIYNVSYPRIDGTLTSELPDKNYLALDNNFFELKNTSTTAKVVYLYLYKESFGFNCNHTQRLLTSEIARRLNLTTRTIQECIRELLSKQIIFRVEDVFSNKGIIYRVLLPQEIQQMATQTPFEFSASDSIARSNSSIETITPRSSISIEANLRTTPNPSIETNDSRKQISPQSIELATHSQSRANLSIEKIEDKESKQVNKSSSGDADLFFDFLKISFDDQTNIFPISKTVAQKYLDQFGLETCKKHITKLKKQILDADSSIGLWIDSLKNPQNYPELNTQDKQQIKQQEFVAAVKEKSFVDEQKKHFESLADDFWEQLSPEQQQRFIDAKRNQLGQGRGDLQIPDVVIKKSAKDAAFWITAQQKWMSLSEDDRVQKLTVAKKDIIKRVYVHKDENGQVRVPDKLPRTEFSSRLGEWAEKVAIVEFNPIKHK